MAVTRSQDGTSTPKKPDSNFVYPKVTPSSIKTPRSKRSPRSKDGKVSNKTQVKRIKLNVKPPPKIRLTVKPPPNINLTVKPGKAIKTLS